MLTQELTPALYQTWRSTWAAHRDRLRPNRISGPALDRYLRHAYPLAPLTDPSALRIVTENVAHNAPWASKLPPGVPPQPVAYWVCLLYTSTAQETNVEAISAAAFASDAFAGRLNEGLTSAAFAQAGNGYPEFLAGCAHDGATHRENARAATCTTAGYTGDLICDLCGETIEAGQAIAPFACPSTGFTDRPATTSWDHAGIDFALNNGLFYGTSSTLFSPSGAMTRAMLVTVLWRLDGRPAPKSSNPFQDVPANQYYCCLLYTSDGTLSSHFFQGCRQPDGFNTLTAVEGGFADGMELCRRKIQLLNPL